MDPESYPQLRPRKMKTMYLPVGYKTHQSVIPYAGIPKPTTPNPRRRNPKPSEGVSRPPRKKVEFAPVLPRRGKGEASLLERSLGHLSVHRKMNKKLERERNAAAAAGNLQRAEELNTLLDKYGKPTVKQLKKDIARNVYTGTKGKGVKGGRPPVGVMRDVVDLENRIAELKRERKKAIANIRKLRKLRAKAETGAEKADLDEDIDASYAVVEGIEEDLIEVKAELDAIAPPLRRR